MSNRFDLDTSLAAWRRSLEFNPAFDADDLDELERHLRDQVAALARRGVPTEDAFAQALREMGGYGVVETEYRKVYWSKRRRRGEVLRELTWRSAMLKNSLKIALRNLARQKGSSFLNVTGLAVGITCCLLIGLYVQHEWSYDRFHDKGDRIFRLIYENRKGADLPPAAPEEYTAWGSAFFAPRLLADFPEIEHAVRLSGRHQILLSRDAHRFQEERYFFADPAFFEVFSFPLLQGDPATALAEPNSIVLTATAAQRYFGSANALGQVLQMGSDETAQTLTVTGLLEDPPANTHLDFDLLLSMSTFEQEARANSQDYVFDNSGYIDFFTYLLLKEGASPEALEAKLPAFVERHIGEKLVDPPQTYTQALEPITEAYLGPVGGFQPGPKGNETSLYLFSLIGLFILLIACVNFMNLATANAAKRAKEVGVRKAVGARRGGLVVRFLSEAILLTALAAGIAVVLTYLTLPFFRDLAGRAISGAPLTTASFLGLLVLGILLIGTLAGSYPAFVLSAFRPVQVLKGAAGLSRGARLRKGLVVFQFAAALVLIVGTLVVHRQLQYVQERSLGFDDAQQLVIDFGGDQSVRINREAIRQELEALPGVQQAAATRSIPGGFFPHATTDVEAPDGTMRQFEPGLFEVDPHFLKQIGVGVAAGRLFDEAYATDAEETLLINEAAARHLGYADPAEAVGKRFEQWGRTGQVVGVVEDFNFESLHHEIRPLSFRVASYMTHFVLAVDAGEATAVVDAVQAAWPRLVPHLPLRFSFLDQSFDAQYRAEERFRILFGLFAGLAIFVACLGLLGLAAFAAAQRTKEIGIRKVLGASEASLMVLLSRDFVRLVLVAFVVAAPIAYFAMERWLSGFAYRIDLGGGVFLLAGALGVLLALLTVSYQAVKAALANPTDSLRYE